MHCSLSGRLSVCSARACNSSTAGHRMLEFDVKVPCSVTRVSRRNFEVM